jgi:uncharacterized membrane protein YphA (DoxX/SURF4 family)
MNITLWIIQILLAAVFLTTGSIKLVIPKKKLEKVFDWIDDFSRNKIKTIAAFEVVGALGLLLPGVYSIYSVIMPLSAIGLSVIMVLAALTHYNRGENAEMIVNIIIATLLAFVIIGRFAI